MIEKIISGGQTGADQGGLEAARELGIRTGGTAPRGWMTETGPQYRLLASYGLTEGPYDPRLYPKRTALNVLNSDATVIFGNVNEPGSRLTLKLCVKYQKPYIVLPSDNPDILYTAFLDWIRTINPTVLNVAGNRESKNRGIQARVKRFLVTALIVPEEGA